MAHFIQVTNNQCGDVIVISNDDINNLPFPESEPVGQAFIASLGLEGQWLQTSYSGSFRGSYAGIGFTFNPDVEPYGEFVAPPIEPAT
jgi:hypothetical protein